MLLILKTGITLDNIRAFHGDFEDWIAGKMQMNPSEYPVHSTGDYNSLPPEKDYSGIINLSETRMHEWLLKMNLLTLQAF